MLAIDFATDFAARPIAEFDSSLDRLLAQLEQSQTTLALATSRRAMVHQPACEAIAETLAVAAAHPRLLPVGTLDPRRYVGWQDDLRACVDGGCVAIRFFPGRQNWTPRLRLFEKMVAAVAETGRPVIVDLNGPGAGSAREWLWPLADLAHRTGAALVLNEVAYSYLGELITVMHDYPEVHAVIRWLCLADMLELMHAEGLTSRLLYGTNAPQYSVTALRNQVLMAEIPDDAKAAILAGNALRLLRLDPAALPVPPRHIKPEADLPARPIIDMHAHVGGFPLPQPNDLAEQTTVPRMSERCNIELTIVSHYNAINYDMRQGNAQTARLLDRHPTLRGYVVCDPRDLAGSVEQMTRYFQDPRFVGVKLYCPFGGNMATYRMQALLDEVARFGRPALIHMDEGGSPYGGLRQACQRNPGLVIIKAHGDEAEGARQVVDLPNVYFEFCSSGIQPGRIRRSLDILGPERVLFGTDQQLFAPWFEYGAYLDAFANEREAELVLRENARRIFRL